MESQEEMKLRFGKKPKKSKQISFRMEEELFDWLKGKSKRENTSTNQLLIDMIAKEYFFDK